MLKVGDKVIIKNLDPNKVMKDEFVLMIGANNLPFINIMRAFCGKQAMIASYRPDKDWYRLDSLPCYWDEHWLEVVTDIAGVNDYDIDSLLRE